MIAFSCLIGSCISARVGDHKNSNILSFYYDSFYKNKKWTSRSGKFFQTTEKQFVDSLENKFDSTNQIVVIKQFCWPFSVHGYIFPYKDGKGINFSRVGENGQLQIYEEHNNDDELLTMYYERIITLLASDSLEFYSIDNKKARDPDDAYCTMSVIKVNKDGSKYEQTRYDFPNPVSLRRKIFKY